VSDPAASFSSGLPVTPRTSPEEVGWTEGALVTPPTPRTPPSVAPAGGGKSANKGGGVRSLIEWVVILVAALTVAFVVKTFFIQAFFIPTGSMEPTLNIGDRVLVNKLSYDLHGIHRGDIVVFKSPPDEVASDPSIKDLIKRVIGLPGDRIQGIDGQVYINGKLLKESYLPPGTLTTNLPLQTVPPGRYFMMGDNRGDSEDSRFIGTIPRNLIVGRAFVRVWPLSRLGLL